MASRGGMERWVTVLPPLSPTQAPGRAEVRAPSGLGRRKIAALPRWNPGATLCRAGPHHLTGPQAESGSWVAADEPTQLSGPRVAAAASG